MVIENDVDAAWLETAPASPQLDIHDRPPVRKMKRKEMPESMDIQLEADMNFIANMELCEDPCSCLYVYVLSSVKESGKPHGLYGLYVSLSTSQKP